MQLEKTKWKTVSPSQMAKFQDCNLKWWFEKILKIETKSSAAAYLGTSIHKEVEDYLIEGYPVNTDQAKALVDVLGFPPGFATDTEGVIVESNANLQEMIPGVKFVGRIDFIDNRDPDFLHIRDFKTSSNPKKYGKTAEGLSTDLQMLSYAFVTLDAIAKEAGWVIIEHSYTKTRGTPEAFLVKKMLEREYVEDFWRETIVPLVNEMQKLSCAPSEKEVPYDLSKCSKYGGCPHKGWCHAYRRKK